MLSLYRSVRPVRSVESAEIVVGLGFLRVSRIPFPGGLSGCFLGGKIHLYDTGSRTVPGKGILQLAEFRDTCVADTEGSAEMREVQPVRVDEGFLHQLFGRERESRKDSSAIVVKDYKLQTDVSEKSQ